MIWVHWVDAVGDPENGWKDQERTDEFFDRRDNHGYEVGFLWHEDDEYLDMISGLMPGEDNMTHHRFKLPKAWIVERKELTFKKTKTSNT